jgi:hypothetical protein
VAKFRQEKITCPLTPSEQANRVYERWNYLFDGILIVIRKHDPGLMIGIMRECERVGLAYNGQFIPAVFTLVPSQEILDKTREFFRWARNVEPRAIVPDLRGKTRHRAHPLSLLSDYSAALGVLQDLPSKKVRNVANRRRVIQERLRKAFPSRESIPDIKKFTEELSDEELSDKKLRSLPPNEIALRFVAQMYHFKKTSTLESELSRARKQYPDGITFVES